MRYFKQFTFSLALILPTVLSAEAPEMFEGRWVGFGYTCYDASNRLVSIPQEIVEIQHVNNQLIATKITGDACVTSGNVTWKMNTTDEIVFDHTYNVIFQVGDRSRPNSGWINDKMQFRNLDEIVVIDDTTGNSNLTFLREQMRLTN